MNNFHQSEDLVINAHVGDDFERVALALFAKMKPYSFDIDTAKERMLVLEWFEETNGSLSA